MIIIIKSLLSLLAEWDFFASKPIEPMEPDSNRVLGPTLLAIYLMISGIVLLNLLIAMVRDMGATN